MWHYHVIDVEALAAGWLARTRKMQAAGYIESEIAVRLNRDPIVGIAPHPPWNSTELSLAVGVDPNDFDRHTALGDAKWAKAIFETVMG